MALQLPPGSFYGETVRSCRVASFELSERLYPPSFQTPKHSHIEMLGETVRRCSTNGTHNPPRWLQQARDLLHGRFSENLTLAEVASAVGVHPVHLAQVFHKNYRCTVGDYMRRLRIEYACHELATSGKPIVDIALAAGFCDQSHFTRTFKRSTGVAPSQYRESLRED